MQTKKEKLKELDYSNFSYGLERITNSPLRILRDSQKLKELDQNAVNQTRNTESS